MSKPITLRFKKRQKQLENPFKKDTLKTLWKHKVKSQVRSMSILDLHDFYDFHRRIDYNTSKINEQIISGQYKSQIPIIYTLEKKFGICRHMIILSPSDTLILQALIEPFCNDLEKQAPSNHAYYSRDKSSSIKLPHEINTDYNDWFEQWKIYQNEILQFTKTKKYIIITDLSNYFDSIRLNELRSVVSGYIKCDEVLLDLIFNIIEDLSWKPDYLPNQSIGMPTINLEAIRLLAHSFLFEIDYLLKYQINENFVRWMDDIVIGIDDIREAKSILSNISDVLKSRGLSLNMSKTKILDASEAKRHFLFDENIQLNIFDKNPPKEKEFMKYFRRHWNKNKQYKNFDKVLKRFLTIAGNNNFTKILKYLPRIFEEYSDLRTNVCQYLYKLGYTKKTYKIFQSLINITRYDDITLFLLVALIIDWNIGYSRVDIENINYISKYLKSLTIKDKEFNFYSYLWFAAKYETPKSIYEHINKYRNLWIKNSFLTRQVSSILFRLLPDLKDEYNDLRSFILQRDYNDASSVIYNMDEIRSCKNIHYLKEYLFPKNKHKKGYPLSKFLILYNFCLENNKLNTLSIENKIKEHIQDKWYLFWLNKIKES